jgi:ArsR family transcriptional regulator, arsenate/arsenite/antimonite-responsive transcriptional repressor
LNYFPKQNIMLQTAPPPTNLITFEKQLKALANPKRLQILHWLMEGVHCNCELGELLGMSPNLISHHMSILRELGLVDMERDMVDGRWVYFSVNEAVLAEFNQAYQLFFNPDRIKPRRPMCGPQGSLIPADLLVVE